MATIYELAKTAHVHNVAAISSFSKVENALQTAADCLALVKQHRVAANQANDSILAQTIPPELTDSGRIKLSSVLLVAGLACAGVGAGDSNFQREETPVAKFSNGDDAGRFLADGRAKMLAKNWRSACESFGAAFTRGADPEQSLGRLAECEFYEGDFTEALRTCATLEAVTKGRSAIPAYIRGLIALKAEQKADAKLHFLAAEMAGHPLAGLAAKRCN